MKILALEFSTAHASLAWLGGGEKSAPYLREWGNDRKNSELFFKNVETAIKEFGLPDRIVVGLGPGSYAGVRIAISTAIGLHAAHDGQLIGYPSICTLRDDGDNFAVVGDARRRAFYFAQIRDHELVDGIQLYSETELQDRLTQLEPAVPVLSSDSLPQFERVEKSYPSAQVLARLALAEKRVFSLPPLEPIYLREAHVTIPKPIFGVTH
jgi:tRNA threonylcarbamoyladenosine biosynthesis protein TsaB